MGETVVWLSIAQAALRIGVSERSIRRYVAAGDLPAYRVGRRRLVKIRAEDVDGLLVRIPTAEVA